MRVRNQLRNQTSRTPRGYLSRRRRGCR